MEIQKAHKELVLNEVSFLSLTGSCHVDQASLTPGHFGFFDSDYQIQILIQITRITSMCQWPQLQIESLESVSMLEACLQEMTTGLGS